MTKTRVRAYVWSSTAAVALLAGFSMVAMNAGAGPVTPATPVPAPRLVPLAAPVAAASSAASTLSSGEAPVHPAQAPAAPSRHQSRRLSRDEVRTLVEHYAARYGVPGLVQDMVWVIHEESRRFPEARSRSGRYVGLCQFMPATFRANVRAMKKAGLLDPAESCSPLDPEDAINVMAWMWSRGLQDQWGPWRRLTLARAGTPEGRDRRN